MDTWTTFAYTKGTFQRIGTGIWKEERDNDSPFDFIEVARTADYIELYGADRNIKVRLYSDAAKWYHSPSHAYITWDGSNGSWV